MGRKNFAVVLLVCAAVLPAPLASRAAAQQNDVWVYTGDNDEEAARQFSNFLLRHDVDIKSVSKKQITLRYKKFSFFVIPVTYTGRQLDRMVMYRVYETEDRWKKTPELIQFTNSLNREYNVGAFYLDEDDDIIFRTQLTFLDRIEWRQMEAFLDWSEDATSQVLGKHQADFNKFVK
jgi:hypothetical protein